MDEVFKYLKWEEKGLKINEKNLTNLRFADDVVLFGNSLKKIKTMLNELEMTSKEAGLSVNKNKTKILVPRLNGESAETNT